MIQKICSLPPNLLIQGKTGLWPVKGAPSKYSGGSSLGREKFVASTEKKKKKEKDYPNLWGRENSLANKFKEK